MSNYDKMAEGARQLFLGYDQEAIIRRWGLEADQENIYLTFLSQPMRIERATGLVLPAEEGAFVSSFKVNETMILFDMLTLTDPRPLPAGTWKSISELGGIIGSGHSRLLSHEKEAAPFAGKTALLRDACARFGREEPGKADVSFIFPVFGGFELWFRFWDADEEFPASIQYLFDGNALQFMHYETLWYLMGTLSAHISWHISQIERERSGRT